MKTGSTVLAPLLCGFVFLLSADAKTKKTKPTDSKLFEKKLSKDDQILHALDRLTFGPRPGDVDRVKKVGLKKWLDQQLHPERIRENPLLETHLAQLESLRMTPLEAVEHYPTPQMIRAIATGKQTMPDDLLLRASLERLVRRYRVKHDEVDTSANPEIEPARALDEVLTPAELAIVRANNNGEQKRELLESMPRERVEDMLIAMTQQERLRLFGPASSAIRREIFLLNGPQQVVNYDLTDSKMLRAIESARQLAEELDDFWFNHFNVYYDKGADRFLLPAYEREAIRPHVLGQFRDLLEATAKSPAMLVFLDNFESVRADLDANDRRRKSKRGLNENYGRELMELHTLGVNGGYTQKDVTEVARCFTGWTIRAPREGGGFFYNDKLHDKGEKVVLGHVIKAGGGMGDGEQVLDILAHHPSTAHHISLELAQRFVTDDPPEELVNRMAQTFLSSNGSIRDVMKTMLNSKEFWSEGAYRAKIKSPFEMVASAVRALDANVVDAWGLSNEVRTLGEPLYHKLEPTGYSNLNAEWLNSASLLGRMNFAIALAGNHIESVRVDVSRFGTDPEEVAKALMFRGMSPQTHAAIDRAFEDNKKNPGLVAALVIGSPDFQKR
ncbi:MAG TPA: DUF1800 domain-containing protein [Bryobacteraceae bacterium]|nr:DUF1800 domain-containing protein [Bryobacteraceae bacterium]